MSSSIFDRCLDRYTAWLVASISCPFSITRCVILMSLFVILFACSAITCSCVQCGEPSIVSIVIELGFAYDIIVAILNPTLSRCSSLMHMLSLVLSLATFSRMSGCSASMHEL